MKVIGIVSQKGGCGKSQFAQSLGVLSNENKGLSVIVDTDVQGTVTKWAGRREAETPMIVEAHTGNLDEVIEAAREEGIKYLWIDTPPHVGAIMHRVVEVSDLVVVPVRPDPSNLDSVEETWGYVQNARNVMAVINGVPTDTSSDGDDVEAYLNDSLPDLPVCKVRLHQRKQFWQPHTAGQAVSEMRTNMVTMKAQGEINALWKAIKKELK